MIRSKSSHRCQINDNCVATTATMSICCSIYHHETTTLHRLMLLLLLRPLLMMWMKDDFVYCIWKRVFLWNFISLPRGVRLIYWGFTSHWTQDMTFRIRHFQPNSWLLIRSERCKVLWWLMSIFVGSLADLRNHGAKLYCVSSWPWLYPPQAALRYVMYFRLSGWRHIFTYVICASRIFLSGKRIAWQPKLLHQFQSNFTQL